MTRNEMGEVNGEQNQTNVGPLGQENNANSELVAPIVQGIIQGSCPESLWPGCWTLDKNRESTIS